MLELEDSVNPVAMSHTQTDGLRSFDNDTSLWPLGENSAEKTFVK